MTKKDYFIYWACGYPEIQHGTCSAYARHALGSNHVYMTLAAAKREIIDFYKQEIAEIRKLKEEDF